MLYIYIYISVRPPSQDLPGKAFRLQDLILKSWTLIPLYKECTKINRIITYWVPDFLYVNPSVKLLPSGFQIQRAIRKSWVPNCFKMGSFLCLTLLFLSSDLIYTNCLLHVLLFHNRIFRSWVSDFLDGDSSLLGLEFSV